MLDISSFKINSINELCPITSISLRVRSQDYSDLEQVPARNLDPTMVVSLADSAASVLERSVGIDLEKMKMIIDMNTAKAGSYDIVLQVTEGESNSAFLDLSITVNSANDPEFTI